MISVIEISQNGSQWKLYISQNGSQFKVYTFAAPIDLNYSLCGDYAS